MEIVRSGNESFMKEELSSLINKHGKNNIGFFSCSYDPFFKQNETNEFEIYMRIKN